MVIEKEIILWRGDVGLTSDMIDVRKLSKAEFPRLIFQDFMSQLKLPKLKIGFELDTNHLLEFEPQYLEELEDSVRFDLDNKNTLNLDDVLMYYLLCKVLHSDFKLSNIYTNNYSKSKLYFATVIPFSATGSNDLNFIRSVVKRMRHKQIQHVLERFFVLLGQHYKDKLLLFLTYLNQKYKFNLDKSAFVHSTLGEDNLMKVERELNQIL